ncbi:MAG: DUF190 domain-containing protein [Nitrospirae bacterium]|nr:DUF190 domain-containing protein [Nitrospirota bacterium]MBF0591855.1 DUF190 domain-containing protein [Nitrospirota bacterium]
MLGRYPAKKLTIYTYETDKFGHRPIYEVLIDIFQRHAITCVNVFRAIEGLGVNREILTAKILEMSTNLPVKVEAIGSEEMINGALADVYQVVGNGLVEVSDTTIIQGWQPWSEGKKEASGHMKLQGRAKMLKIIISEDDKWHGEPLYEAIVKRLIVSDIAGATVYKAMAGYGAHHRYHKKKLFTSEGELSVVIVVVDTQENINKALPILDDMVTEGIVIVTDVDVIKYTHRDTQPDVP